MRLICRSAILSAVVPATAALSANCSCSEFCAGTCAATNAGRPTSLTMYRLTPGNVTELVDKDTGGSAGDLGFVFQRLSSLAHCTPSQANENGCFLALDPVIKQFFVDVDGKYGPYMRCNPMQFEQFTTTSSLVDTKRWSCYPWHGRGPTPWDPATGHGSSSCADNAYCGALMNASVGRDPAMHHAFNPQRPNIAEYFGGEWYSLHHDGQCGGGRAPGDGKKPSCSWRETPGKIGKTINVTCLLKHVLPILEKNGHECFSACPQPSVLKNDSAWRDHCYLNCVPKAVMGSKDPPIGSLAPDLPTIAWNKAFSSSNPQEGGCPDVGKNN